MPLRTEQFPNGGYVTPQEPRDPAVPFPGLPPVHTVDGGVLPPLADEVFPVHITSAVPGSYVAPQMWTPTTQRGSVTCGEITAPGPHFLRTPPRQGSWVARTDVFDSQVLDWIARFNQPLCRGENLVQMSSDDGLVATPSASSLVESE